MRKFDHKIIAFFDAIMVLLFLFAVVVQYNDPDAIRWMLIYGGAALSSILWLTNHYSKAFCMVVMAIALIWMALILPDVWKLGTFNSHMFDSFTMHNIGIEEAREVGGLMIVAAWMIVISFIFPYNKN